MVVQTGRVKREELTSRAPPRRRRRSALLLLLLIQTIPHQVLDAMSLLPFLILCVDLVSCGVLARVDAHLKVITQMALAGDVGEQVTEVGKGWLLRADIAVEWNLVDGSVGVVVAAAFAVHLG